MITGVVANLLMLVTLIYAALLWSFDGDLYYFSAQEDEYLEWATFWAFISATGAYLLLLTGDRVEKRGLWFILCLAAFCFIVAMEEISWGQRILGYRPPDYFLENNYQQEINFHNVLDTDIRKLGVYAAVLGFGIILPLATLVPVMHRLVDKCGILVPNALLIPGFAAAGVFQFWYPLKFSGEWVELMLGCGLLFAALWAGTPSETHDKRPHDPTIKIIVAWVLIISMGLATAMATRNQRDDDPQLLEAAKTELQALARDFKDGELGTRCGLHKRLYTYAHQYDQGYLLEGTFRGLTRTGMPESRAEFLLDPWNSPYWLRDICDRKAGRRATLIYSFGPNRRRDSTPWALKGDDIGLYLRNVQTEN